MIQIRKYADQHCSLKHTGKEKNSKKLKYSFYFLFSKAFKEIFLRTDCKEK